MLKLERPLCFLDIESTGVDPEKDKIIELSIIKYYESLDEKEPNVREYKFNPGIHIPQGASDVHGITDDQVDGWPLFNEHAEDIFLFISSCDLAGFNSNRFDVPLLYRELLLSGYLLNYRSINLLDVGNLYKIKEPRTLTAAVKFYNDKDHNDAHGATADTVATAEVFKAQLKKYADLPQSVSELSKMANYDRPILDLSGKFSTDEDGEIIYNFGKNKGVRVKDDLSYLDWMLNKASFSPDTVAIGVDIINDIHNPKDKGSLSLF